MPTSRMGYCQRELEMIYQPPEIVCGWLTEVEWMWCFIWKNLDRFCEKFCEKLWTSFDTTLRVINCKEKVNLFYSNIFSKIKIMWSDYEKQND